MQVTHIEEAKSHVVVGGQNVRAFGMSDTAEFFELLSNALYSNKRMAVVREVLCNAWDAHIASGRQDIPVRITLDNQKLVFKDSGFGIHDQVIGPIYCVYGNSTKSHNGEENGGFGLGSKAPFAYTDHFTVTSCHQGTKTVYAISRGSAETNGKPDFRTVVSVPTKEQGLEVHIPIKKISDVLVFRSLIAQITLFGDMNVELNGVALPRLPFSSAPDGAMLIARESPVLGEFALGFEPIWVRYGTVIYPVADEEYYAKYYNVLKGLTLNNKYILVLQAPPNKISVTPSRESLSMTDMTKSTLLGLMSEAVARYKEANSTHIFYDLADLAARMVFYKGAHHNQWLQFAYNLSFHNISGLVQALGPYSTNFYDIKRFLMAKTTDFRGPTHIPSEVQFGAIFEALARHAPKHLLPEIRMIRKLPQRGYRYYNRGDMLYQSINHMRLTKLENALPKDLQDKLRYVHRKHYGKSDFTPVQDITHDTIRGLVDLSKIVVGMNQDDILQDARKAKIEEDFICVYQPRKKGQKEAAINALTRNGYEVVDATVDYVPKPRKTPTTKRDKGYMLLSEISPQGFYKEGFLSQNGKKRVLHPKVAFYETSKDRERILNGWAKNPVWPILELIPDVVVVSNERTYETLKAKYKTELGVPHLISMLDTMLDDPTSGFVEYLAFQDSSFASEISHLSRIGQLDKEVGDLLGYTYQDDPKLKAAAAVVNLFSQYGFSGMARNVYTKAQKKVEDYQSASKVIQDSTKNPSLDFLDLASIHEAIKSSPKSKTAGVAKRLLLEALKG